MSSEDSEPIPTSPSLEPAEETLSSDSTSEDSDEDDDSDDSKSQGDQPMEEDEAFVNQVDITSTVQRKAIDLIFVFQSLLNCSTFFFEFLFSSYCTKFVNGRRSL